MTLPAAPTPAEAPDVALREKVFRLLSANPEIRQILTRALKVEESGRVNQYYLGWEWEDVAVPPYKLRVLIEEQLIKVSYHSHSSKNYLVKDPELVREALSATASAENPIEEGEIPENLFTHIVGHDEVKYWLLKSLTSPKPVHIILVGPPATAKSLFLEGLATIPGAQYALGGASTKAGIAEFLLFFQPRYLVIDELEKMNRDDFSVLLSLMSIGLVARMKKGMRDVQRMTVTVYAGVNRAERLPPELLSRFLRFNFNTYTLEEFIKVAVAVITADGKDPELARYIAEKVVLRTRDVRQAIQLGKLVDTKEEVDRFMEGHNA